MSAERLAPLPAAIFALALVYGIFTAGLEIEPRFWRWAGLRAERRHREMLKRVAAAEHECGLDGHKDVDWQIEHLAAQCPECRLVLAGYRCTCPRCMSGV